MKKTSKPPAKKPAVKKPAAKKSSTKPKRRAEGQSELVAVLTHVADGQTRLGHEFGRLIEITNNLVEAVGRLSEGVEVLLQASQEDEPANEPQLEAPGEVVGVMMVDETENGDGEGGGE
jgi:hypothetical protein